MKKQNVLDWFWLLGFGLFIRQSRDVDMEWVRPVMAVLLLPLLPLPRRLEEKVLSLREGRGEKLLIFVAGFVFVEGGAGGNEGDDNLVVLFSSAIFLLLLPFSVGETTVSTGKATVVDDDDDDDRSPLSLFVVVVV